MEVDYLDLVGEGYMGSMQWQLGREMGTIPAFASRTQENQENLGREENLCASAGENKNKKDFDNIKMHTVQPQKNLPVLFSFKKLP